MFPAAALTKAHHPPSKGDAGGSESGILVVLRWSGYQCFCLESMKAATEFDGHPAHGVETTKNPL
jgi:hypothetical protein